MRLHGSNWIDPLELLEVEEVVANLFDGSDLSQVEWFCVLSDLHLLPLLGFLFSFKIVDPSFFCDSYYIRLIESNEADIFLFVWKWNIQWVLLKRLVHIEAIAFSNE